jgi:phosphate transport system permease protein
LLPLGLLAIFVASDLATRTIRPDVAPAARWILFAAVTAILVRGLLALAAALQKVAVASGTNALNVSIILGVMALPTIVSVAEDSLQAAGRELREGSYALGATRAETLFKVVIPAAGSGIIAAVILGVMRAIGETMVVWMASGNAAQIPQPWYNLLSPVRTLTATIAGDMGEADQVLGSERYHVLFALALSLLLISFLANLASEWILRRQTRRLGGLR